jgi:hypothetical protein
VTLTTVVHCCPLPAAPLLCSPSTATFNGPVVFASRINVTCELSRTLGPGVYALQVQAAYTGKPPCASGVSPIATGQFFVAADPNPPADTVAYSKAPTCRYCSAPGMYGKGVESAQMVAGPISRTCKGAGRTVGTVSVTCIGSVLSFSIKNPPGSTPSVKFFARCQNPARTCPAWVTPSPSPKVNGLTGPTVSGVTKFSVRVTGCRCANTYWGIKQTGRFAQ